MGDFLKEHQNHMGTAAASLHAQTAFPHGSDPSLGLAASGSIQHMEISDNEQDLTLSASRASDLFMDGDLDEFRSLPASPLPPPPPDDAMGDPAGWDSKLEALDDHEPLNQEDDAPHLPATPYDELLPNATLPKLKLAQQMIGNIQSAKLEDDIKDPELLESLNNPAAESGFLDDDITKLSIDIFIGLTGGSQQFYNNVRDALSWWKSDVQLHSYYIV